MAYVRDHDCVRTESLLRTTYERDHDCVRAGYYHYFFPLMSPLGFPRGLVLDTRNLPRSIEERSRTTTLIQLRPLWLRYTWSMTCLITR